MLVTIVGQPVLHVDCRALQVFCFAQICGNLALNQIIPGYDVGRRAYVTSLRRRISPLLGATLLGAVGYGRGVRLAC